MKDDHLNPFPNHLRDPTVGVLDPVVDVDLRHPRHHPAQLARRQDPFKLVREKLVEAAFQRQQLFLAEIVQFLPGQQGEVPAGRKCTVSCGA